MSTDRHRGIPFLGWERHPATAADLPLGFIRFSLASVSLSKKPNKPLENKDWYACVGGGWGQGVRERSAPLLIRITFLSIFLEYSPKQSRKEAAKLYLSLAALLAWG